jgi:hypothetical protein
MVAGRGESIAPAAGSREDAFQSTPIKETAMRLRSALAALLLVPALLPALAGAQDAPVCVYDSRSFSEGASLCVQRHLMMSCAVTDTRAVWKLVEDRAISRMCLRPTRPAAAESASPPRRQLARRLSHAARGGEAKCFVFNGKRYCE